KTDRKTETATDENGFVPCYHRQQMCACTPVCVCVCVCGWCCVCVCVCVCGCGWCMGVCVCVYECVCVCVCVCSTNVGKLALSQTMPSPRPCAMCNLYSKVFWDIIDLKNVLNCTT